MYPNKEQEIFFAKTIWL
ncbi:hypothetical protein [Bacillus paramycoides]